MKSVSHIILATLLSTGAVMAQETVDFDSHDKDGDGYLSDQEWADVEAVVVEFDTIDMNRDGRLDRSEVQTGTQRSGSMDSSGDMSASGQSTGSTDVTSTSGQDSMDSVAGTSTELTTSRDQAASVESTSASQPSTSDSTSTSAQQTGSSSATTSGDGKQAFRDTDADRDNRVSQQEAQDAGYDYVVIYFDPMDSNRDGYLDESEWEQGEDTGINMDNENVGFEDSDLYMNGDGAQDTRFETSNYKGENGSELFREDFDRYDVNEDGYLDEAEVTESDWVDINLFEKSDANDDGLIDIGEAEDGFMELGDDEQESDVEY